MRKNPGARFLIFPTTVPITCAASAASALPPCSISADHAETMTKLDLDWPGSRLVRPGLGDAAAGFARQPTGAARARRVGDPRLRLRHGNLCRNLPQEPSARRLGDDIIRPKFGVEHFLPKVDRKFDIVVACEVMEHIPTPRRDLPRYSQHAEAGRRVRIPDRGIRSGHRPRLVVRRTRQRPYQPLFPWRVRQPVSAAGRPFAAVLAQLSGVQAWRFDAPEAERPDARRQQLEDLLQAVYRSTSWKVTAPLRGIRNIFKGRN